MASEPISITLPGWLISAIDDFCLKNDFNRSQLVARAIREYLLRKMDKPDFWEQHISGAKNGKTIK